jgi:outer membrane protein TolC
MPSFCKSRNLINAFLRASALSLGAAVSLSLGANAQPNSDANPGANPPVDSNTDLRPPLTAAPQPDSNLPKSSASVEPSAPLVPQDDPNKRRKFIPTQPATGANATKLLPQLSGDASKFGQKGPIAALDSAPDRDRISLAKPELKALITVNDYLSPFGLDATSSESLNLRNALLLSMDRNLDLAISRTNVKIQQNSFYSSLGRFLPDFNMQYSEYFAKGKIAFPFNSLAGSLGGTSAATTGSTTSALSSSTATASNTIVHVDNPFILMNTGFTFYGYRGGRVLFGALEQRNNLRAARAGEKATLSDTLLTVTKNYYNLVLSEALLQIRIQAVRTSEEQLRNNKDLFEAGLATNLDVLQSKTQLARDRQGLVDQQIARRNAAITLANTLNANLGADISAVDSMVRKVRLVDPKMKISDLLRIAIDNRPELKQYEELRKAAKKQIIVAQAPLQPTFALTGSVYGLGPPSSVEALFVLGINARWQLGGFGTVDAFNTQTARWQARQAQLTANKELVTVLNQVRSAILQSLDTERNIEEASDEVASSLEELRLAQLRFQSGLGTNLDIITAQRDYTQAQIDKAQAMINFDIAQAQLLHDVGMTSVDGLTSGRLLSSAN